MLMARLRPAAAVIFDMDGVLLDTERLYTEATQQIVGRYGKTFDWTIKSHMVGRPAIESARYLVETLSLPILPEEYLAERETELAKWMPEAAPMPGAESSVQPSSMTLTETASGLGRVTLIRPPRTGRR